MERVADFTGRHFGKDGTAHPARPVIHPERVAVAGSEDPADDARDHDIRAGASECVLMAPWAFMSEFPSISRGVYLLQDRLECC